MTTVVPPALILILGAFLLPLLSGGLRNAFALLLPVVVLAMVWMVPDGPVLEWSFLGLTLTPLEGSAIGRLFATIFAIATFAGGLFAFRQAKAFELAAAYAYAGGSIGVALAGDLVTVLIYWELMAIGSTAVILSAGTGSARRASMRYLLVHLFGGLLLMIGIVAHIWQTGSVDFTAIPLTGLAAWLILAGVLVNAPAPPLSAWLPDAYPEGSAFGTVFLSAFTTKTAVFALWVMFAGADVLIWFGLYMVFYGIVYALLENDIRRILAYSIVNQVGYMMTAIGIGTELALNGAAAHAFAHIIYKALLLMSAGSVLYMTGKRNSTDLGGLYRTMPVTMWCGIVGAMAISAFPLTSGFATKSMISSAAEYENLAFIWYMLTAASAGAFLYVGVRFPWFVFFQKDSGLRPPDPPGNMRAGMILLAFLCVFLGVYPDPLYAMLPFPVDYVPYTGAHVVAQSQLLLFSALAFFLLLPILKRGNTITLDFDWFYRVALPVAGRAVGGIVFDGWGRLLGWGGTTYQRLYDRIHTHHGPQGVLARTWPTGSTVLWIAVLLAGYLLLSFFGD